MLSVTRFSPGERATSTEKAPPASARTGAPSTASSAPGGARAESHQRSLPSARRAGGGPAAPGAGTMGGGRGAGGEVHLRRAAGAELEGAADGEPLDGDGVAAVRGPVAREDPRRQLEQVVPAGGVGERDRAALAEDAGIRDAGLARAAAAIAIEVEADAAEHRRAGLRHGADPPLRRRGRGRE